MKRLAPWMSTEDDETARVSSRWGFKYVHGYFSPIIEHVSQIWSSFTMPLLIENVIQNAAVNSKDYYSKTLVREFKYPFDDQGKQCKFTVLESSAKTTPKWADDECELHCDGHVVTQAEHTDRF